MLHNFHFLETSFDLDFLQGQNQSGGGGPGGDKKGDKVWKNNIPKLNQKHQIQIQELLLLSVML